MATTKAPSLAHKRRRDLLKRPEAKGDPRKQNLWVIRAFDGSRIVLASDLALHHFLFTEGDPSVSTVCYYYRPSPDDVDAGGICFDALVTFCNGSKVCRHVRAASSDLSVPRQAEHFQACQRAARDVGASYAEITAAELDRSVQRIRNWTRLLAAYRRCAHRPLDVLEKLLIVHLTRAGQSTIQTALTWIPDASHALVIAALARLLRKRQIASDLDEATWSLHTRIGVTTP